MATTRVQLPDGNFGEFPASMKPEDIQAVLAKQFPPPEPPPTMAHRAGGMAKDFGKGVLESVGGTLDTIGAPVGWAAHKMGIANETPEQRQQQEQLFKPANAAQAVGAGLGDAAQAMIPVERAIPLLGKAGKAISEFAEPLTNKIGEFNQAWNPLPLKSRAINTLNEVANAAKDVPVQTTMTDPAVQGFRDYVKTGGRPSPVVSKLSSRMSAIEPKQPNMLRRMESELSGTEPLTQPKPLMFPEARGFYSNVSEASARPGFLRRAVEPSAMPKQRYQLGNVRQAMNTDLTNTAEQAGMGEKYMQGMNEFRNAARLSKGLKIGAGIATEEALRRSGLLGKAIAPLMGQ